MRKSSTVFFVLLACCAAPEETDFIVRPIRGGEIPKGSMLIPSDSGPGMVALRETAGETTKIFFNTLSPAALEAGVLSSFQMAVTVWNTHPCVNRDFFTLAPPILLGEIDPNTACVYRPDGVLITYVTSNWPNYPGEGKWSDVLGCALICKATGHTHHIFINASGNEKSRHRFSPPWRHPNGFDGEYSMFSIAVHELGHVLAERAAGGKNTHINDNGTENVMDGTLRSGTPFAGFTREDDRWICSQFD